MNIRLNIMDNQIQIHLLNEMCEGVSSPSVLDTFINADVAMGFGSMKKLLLIRATSATDLCKSCTAHDE